MEWLPVCIPQGAVLKQTEGGQDPEAVFFQILKQDGGSFVQVRVAFVYLDLLRYAKTQTCELISPHHTSHNCRSAGA